MYAVVHNGFVSYVCSLMDCSHLSFILFDVMYMFLVPVPYVHIILYQKHNPLFIVIVRNSKVNGSFCVNSNPVLGTSSDRVYCIDYMGFSEDLMWHA